MSISKKRSPWILSLVEKLFPSQKKQVRRLRKYLRIIAIAEYDVVKYKPEKGDYAWFFYDQAVLDYNAEKYWFMPKYKAIQPENQ